MTTATATVPRADAPAPASRTCPDASTCVRARVCYHATHACQRPWWCERLGDARHHDVPRCDALIEPAFLGAHLAYPACLDLTWPLLAPADFIDARHRAIWHELLRLRRAGRPAHLLALSAVADWVRPDLAKYVDELARGTLRDDADWSVLLHRAATIRRLSVLRGELAATADRTTVAASALRSKETPHGLAR